MDEPIGIVDTGTDTQLFQQYQLIEIGRRVPRSCEKKDIVR